MGQIDSQTIDRPLHTNTNFQHVLDELALLGDEATRDPIDDPLYQEFIARFPADRLPQLSLAEYCIGKGDGRSFCWWLEHGLEPAMFRYKPGNSRGHILYFQKDGTVYKHSRLRALSDEEALRYTLLIQACIGQADMSRDPRWIDNDSQIYERAGVDSLVTVGDGRKLRLLACYHPNETLPISSSPHLAHFLNVLGCPAVDLPPKHQPVARMLLLRRYFELARLSVPGLTPRGFIKALYSERLGLAPIKDNDIPDDADLDERSDTKKSVRTATVSESPIGQPLNQILYGPPGTGKTYATIDASLSILDPAFLAANLSNRKVLKARFDAYVRERRVRFVTFHQSFSYEDFVEGIRAGVGDETVASSLSYSVERGVFGALCADAARNLKADERLGVGPSPTVWKLSISEANSKDNTRRYCLEHGEARIGWENVGDIRQVNLADPDLHLGPKDQASLQNFAHEMQIGDVVLCLGSKTTVQAVGVVASDYQYSPTVPAGVRANYVHRRAVRWLNTQLDFDITALNGGKQLTQQTVYPLTRIEWPQLEAALRSAGALPEAVTAEKDSEKPPYVLVIDEINRGNISRIFGELITLIEPSKRAGASEALEVLLPYSKKPFSVPANVYLIGTMNTADRSLSTMDVALRRRFVFKEMPPRPGLLQGLEVGAIRIDELLTVMNQRIEALLGRDHCLGHAYFMPLREDDSAAKLAEIFRAQVLPLLQEYFFDDWQRIQWVLNDHRKHNKAYCFVINSEVDVTDMFGETVNVTRSPHLWRINEDAFLCEQSYLGVINHEDASA